MKSRESLPLVLAAAGVALGLVITLGVKASQRREAAPVRRVAPKCEGSELAEGSQLPTNCRFETLDGNLVTIRELLDSKPAILNFWASWCTYCIKEMPVLESAHLTSKGKVAFIGLDLLSVKGETRQAAMGFAKDKRVSYPLVYDPDGAFYSRFISRVLPPTTIFVRADGTVAFRRFGEVDGPTLRAMIKEHLGVSFDE